jgi:serpin B
MVSKAIEVTKEVNMWVEKETDGLIEEVLSPGSVDTETRLIFANAMYFKGTWNEKFDALKTKCYEFHLLNGKSVKVPFMTSKKQQFIRVFDDFKVLRLPYKQGKDKRQFSMYIFLPNEKKGLPTLVKKVASNSELLRCKLPFIKVKVGDFRIPKFKFSFGFETPDMMKKLGVVLPFSRGGLTKIADSPSDEPLYVSNIFHKSFIEVNEKGTEAVAVTAKTTRGGCCNISPGLDFVADHPFLFLIGEDSSGTILFMGQMLNPLVK